MSYTPVELRHVRVGRRPLGYHRASVEQILNDVADSFETVWRDRGELADKVELLEQQVEDLKNREQVLTNTLVAAERAAEEMKDRAKREAQLILTEAHGEARAIARSGQSERERLSAEVRRIEALLRSALGIVVEVGEPAATPLQVEPAATVASVQPEPAAAPEQPSAAVPVVQEEPREARPVTVAPSPEEPEVPEPELAALPEPDDDEAAKVEPVQDEADEEPGWPPLRRVAQGGAHFDWGD
jgi:cell division initiation protein